MSKKKINPLIIDLDGTLINSDLLFESTLSFIIKNPINAFKVVKYLFSGKANLKYKIAQNIKINPKYLPYNTKVIDLIKKEKAKSRKIILATASNYKYARQISDYLKLFDDVFASDKNTNFSKNRKADKLAKNFSENNFDYAGNSNDDLPIWSKCNIAYIVKPSIFLMRKLKRIYKEKNSNRIKTIENNRNYFNSWFKQLRIHQWSKNLLIFIPLVASHNIGNLNLIYQSLLAFTLFSLCASSVYILNDLVDIENDRAHKTKRNRPIASGILSIPLVALAGILLIAVSFTGAIFLLPSWFFVSLISYYLLTFSYSFFLKKLEVFDVIILASLYTIRIISGAFAISSNLTFWILAFSMFIFLSLALVKRYSEIYEQKKAGDKNFIPGRGYCPEDLGIISSLGVASGYLSVLILALYIQDPNTIELYNKPRVIWFACPLFLFWISRIWILTHRGKIHEDPVFFAITDRVSWVVITLLAIIFWYAS